MTFSEKFVALAILTSPLIGLQYLQRCTTTLDLRRGNPNYPIFLVQLKIEDQTHSNIKEPILNPVEIFLHSRQKIHFGFHRKFTLTWKQQA